MKKEKLKQAFLKIKEDILNLGKEISEIREQLFESNQLMKQINEEILQLKLQDITSTQNQKTPTHPATSTQTPTHPPEIEGLKAPNLPSSIGNQGVSTDRQTNQQTDQQIFRQIISRKIPLLDTTKTLKIPREVVPKKQIQDTEEQIEKPITQQIEEASDLLDSLDDIKKQIRRQFKRITKQEMLVFSTIYQLEEQKQESDYKKIALKLGLSESSIRDYVHRMINKGIPIQKEKLNNKKIILHISPELKKIASLATIIKLREL